MISKPRARALALTVFLAALPGAGLAQYLPEPGPVPDGISASEAEELEAHYWAIEDLAAALEPLIEQHESRCASVDTRDSALMAECAEREAFLSEEIDYYFGALDDYDRSLAAAKAAALKAPQIVGPDEELRDAPAPTADAWERSAASAQANGQIELVELRLAQEGVVLNSWGGRVYKFTCVAEHDCAWVRVTDSSQFKPDDEVRIFPGGFVTVTLPNGQAVRYDPEADGSREVIVDLGYVYDEEMYRWEDSSPLSPDGSIDPPAASQSSSELRVPNLYVDPESLGLEPPSFTGPKTKVYFPLSIYEDRGPNDRAGVCRMCDSPLID